MPEERFEDNLLRMISAVLYQSLTLTAAREMYGKSYFALGVGEKAIVDQSVFASVSSNYVVITAEALKKQGQQQKTGFQAPPGTAPPGTGE